jgi:hypothetical protein
MGDFGKLTSVKDLPSKSAMTKYVKNAMALVDAGVKLERSSGGGRPKEVRGKTSGGALTRRVAQTSAVEVPPELAKALRSNPDAKAAFDAFSPSHRREYTEWIAEAKKAETKERRVLQAIEMLAEGKSRNWKYETKK